MKETMLVSAFPGCGKSHLFKNKGNKVILDSDSSTFDKSEFPKNYIKHIKENIGKADVILISSHDVVRDALLVNGIKFTLVYPDITIKDEYIQRYIDRGNNEQFVKLLKENWETWIADMEKQKGCKHIKLQSGQYLSDVIKLKV